MEAFSNAIRKEIQGIPMGKNTLNYVCGRWHDCLHRKSKKINRKVELISDYSKVKDTVLIYES